MSKPRKGSVVIVSSHKNRHELLEAKIEQEESFFEKNKMWQAITTIRPIDSGSHAFFCDGVSAFQAYLRS
jgi:hypothetical protein